MGLRPTQAAVEKGLGGIVPTQGQTASDTCACKTQAVMFIVRLIGFSVSFFCRAWNFMPRSFTPGALQKSQVFRELAAEHSPPQG